MRINETSYLASTSPDSSKKHIGVSKVGQVKQSQSRLEAISLRPHKPTDEDKEGRRNGIKEDKVGIWAALQWQRDELWHFLQGTLLEEML